MLFERSSVEILLENEGGQGWNLLRLGVVLEVEVGYDQINQVRLSQQDSAVNLGCDRDPQVVGDLSPNSEVEILFMSTIHRSISFASGLRKIPLYV